MDIREITLGTLAHGAADELFRAALTQVLENIENPNTDHKGKRVIGLTFSFVSDEERRIGDVEIKASVKLVGVRGVRTLVFFGKRDGARIVVEQPSQNEMFPHPQGGPRPVPAAKESTA
jgi:hypothetical protein